MLLFVLKILRKIFKERYYYYDCYYYYVTQWYVSKYFT